MGQLQTILWIGAAGSIGALSRYGVNVATKHFFGEAFAIGTLVVNVVGCLLLGILSQIASSQVSEQWRLVLGVGFLGALTTFSTFGVDTMTRIDEGAYGHAILNVMLNLVLGLTAVVIGFAIGKSISGGAT